MNTTHRHFIGIAFSLAIMTHLPLPAIAQSGELLVQAQLDPFIAVAPVNNIVQIPSTSTGDFSGSFSFLVESNTASVSVYAIVTNLYKDTDPSDTTVEPIDVNTAAGVDISPSSARTIMGSDWNAAFTSTTSVNKPSGMFDAHQTEQVNMESNQGGVFDQDIDLTVTWTRDETLRPAGVYGGYIQLFVSAVP